VRGVKQRRPARLERRAVIAFGFLAGCAPVVADYAPIKKNICPCDRSTVRLALPQSFFPNRGIVLGTGTHLSRYAGSVVVDFDRQVVKTVRSELLDDRVELGSESTIRLADRCVAAITRAANEVWNPPAPRKRVMRPVDVQSTLYLFDGAEIYEGRVLFGDEQALAALVEAAGRDGDCSGGSR
jgi:hypothetical protein